YFTEDLNYTESDATNIANNDFSYSHFSQHRHTHAGGVNVKLGVIYRPISALRFGLAFHTPTLFHVTDELDAQMTTDTEGYAGENTSKSADFANASREIKYIQTTPYRVIASAVYILQETENVKMQRGFISADVEFLNHRGSRYAHDPDSDPDPGDDYYDAVGDVIKSYYKGAFNFRLGAELKFSPIAVRFGGAYYSSPY